MYTPASSGSRGQVGLPPLDAFYPSTMDVYSGNATLPPPAGNLRTEDASVLICGCAIQGFGNAPSANHQFSHILLCDPAVQLRDGYTGDGSVTTASEDILAVPANQTNNFLSVFLTYLALIPGRGKTRVILAERRGTPGDWTTLP